MSTHDNPLGGLRSSLADAAFAVEERVLWRGKDGMNGLLDAARWPFERLAWAFERAVIWPLEERTGDWSGGLRTLGVLAAALAAVALGVLGLVWTAGGGSGSPQSRAPASSPTRAIAQQAEAAEQPAAVLHGATPDFTLQGVGGAAKVGEGTGAAEVPAQATSSTETAGSSTESDGKPAGPAAIKIAHRFAGAFVLYETGENNAEVRRVFGETATPRLTRTLLRRPPRLPANANVPQAKVVNIVPGPHHGDTYTFSISLLRLGITSELRVDMQRNPKGGEWQVADVLG